MEKIDYKKLYSKLYQPSARNPALIEVPAMNFLMVDGQGDPNRSPAYQEAIRMLYALAFTIKFLLKRPPNNLEYVVPPLEGLWWIKDSILDFSDKSHWLWTSMIMQPDTVTPEVFQQGLKEVKRKKELSSLESARFERFHEGFSAQILHLGPFSEEKPTIERLHHFMEEQGMQPRGKHHEIYLSDPRKVPPGKWRTVIRQPVEPKS